MNILLDYIFPVTAIEPTPEASTSFLKQALLVVAPKDGGVTTGVITECVSNAEIAALAGTTAAAEAAQLLSGGLAKVFILPMDDLDLADALEGHESDFFTVIISSDFADEDIGSVSSAAVKASKKIQDITYTAKTAGTAGNSITINYNTGGTGGSINVDVTSSAITIEIEDGVSTAAQIKTAVENSVSAMALLDALAVDSGDESDVQAVFGAAINLENGAAAVVSGDLDVGDFKGVVALSSDDDTFLATQAAISNRCAFHTKVANTAKNMCYAFGKLLSNASDWLNQQYITMPFTDDVDTLGEAQSLFEDRISFVIADTQYSNKLSFFGCGGKAIVAPYITRNLEIDMQSAVLSYISGNQPAYSLKQAALIEDELQKVIQSYIDRQWLTAGTVEVTLENDNFVATSNINISEPNALWKIEAVLRQTL